MSQKQVKGYHVIMGTLEGKITVKEAAEKLKLSERQITRLRKGVREKGAAFLIHKNKNKASTKATPEETRRNVVERYRSEKYQGSELQALH